MEELLKNNSQYKGKQKKRLIDYFSVFERDIEGKVTCVSFPSKTNYFESKRRPTEGYFV